VKEDEMCRARSTKRTEEKWIQGFGGKSRRDHYEDLDVGMIILKITSEK
jgi:hypothetical protein